MKGVVMKIRQMWAYFEFSHYPAYASDFAEKLLCLPV